MSEKEKNTENEQEEYITSTDSRDILADVVAEEKKADEKPEAAKPEPDEEDAEDEQEKKPKKKREHKKLRHGMMSTIYTVVFVVVIVLVNIIAGIFFEKYPIKFDLTKNNTYSISEESEEYIKSVTEDVTIRVFGNEEEFVTNDYTKQANEVMKRYSQYNDKIKVEYIDIDSNPDVVSEYTDQEISQFSILVEAYSKDDNGNIMKDDSGKPLKRIREVSLLDLIQFTDDFEQNVANYGMSAEDYILSYAGGDTNTAFALAVQNNLVASSTADQAFVSAIMGVTDPDPVVVSVLTGREESADITYLKKLLVANGYTVEDVNITSEDIPEDADLCVIPAPAVDYMEAEITKVDEFLNNDGKMGKNLIYIASLYQQETPNLDEFLEEYYISIGDGFICENDPEHYYTAPYITVSGEVSESFAAGLGDSQILASASRPIVLLQDEKGKITTEAYVSSTDQAYLARYKEDGTVETFEYGKQIYAAVSSKASFNDDGSANYSNILAVGSESILSDSYLRYNQYQNREYFLSVINGMTGKTSVGITIEPKVITGELFEITAQQVTTLKIVFIGVIPALTLIIGLVIWLRRKNR